VNVLIDSSGWIEFFANGKNAEKWRKLILSADKKTHITPSTVLYEVYKKIKRDFAEEKADEAIAYIIDSTRVIQIDEGISIDAAEKSLVHGLAMADAIIKATADLNNAKIITGDSHFKTFENALII